MTEDIKKEDVKEEEATETTEEVVEEVSEPSELEEAKFKIVFCLCVITMSPHFYLLAL